MSDIVKVLRSPEVFFSMGGMHSQIAHEAADEIERLRDLLKYTVISHHELTNTVLALATERDALSAKLAAAIRARGEKE